MSPASAAAASGSVFGAVVATGTSRSSTRGSSSLRGIRRFAHFPDRASGRVAIGHRAGATTATTVSGMFVRAASRRVSGLTSRLTGRGLVAAAARFSGANGDDRARRDPQVEFFGGDDSDASVAAAGGAAGAGAGGAPRGGGADPGAHPRVARARGGRRVCAPPPPSTGPPRGAGPARPRRGGRRLRRRHSAAGSTRPSRRLRRLRRLRRGRRPRARRRRSRVRRLAGRAPRGEPLLPRRRTRAARPRLLPRLRVGPTAALWLCATC